MGFLIDIELIKSGPVTNKAGQKHLILAWKRINPARKTG